MRELICTDSPTDRPLLLIEMVCDGGKVDTVVTAQRTTRRAFAGSSGTRAVLNLYLRTVMEVEGKTGDGVVTGSDASDGDEIYRASPPHELIALSSPASARPTHSPRFSLLFVLKMPIEQGQIVVFCSTFG